MGGHGYTSMNRLGIECGIGLGPEVRQEDEMQSGSDAGRRPKRLKRRGVWFLLVAVCLPLLVALVCVCRPQRFGLDQELNHRAESWYNENAKAHDRFRQLAKEKDWRMYARAHHESLGRFDFARFAYEPLYSPPAGRWILQTSMPSAGRVAFTECTPRRSRGGQLTLGEFHLCVAEREGTVTKLRLEGDEFRWWPPEQRLVALGPRFVFFASDKRAYVYDIQPKSLETVYELEKGEWLGTRGRVLLAERKFLILLLDSGGGDMTAVVLDADEPHPVMSRVQGLSNAILVGEHIVIEKGDTLFLYEPRSGETERVASGKLAISLGEDEFVFQDEKLRLRKYKIGSRSTELLRSEPTGTDRRRVMVSPDHLFLFLPQEVWWGGRFKWTAVLEYQGYDLASGEKRGAFLVPHVGGRFLEFLGWEKTD